MSVTSIEKILKKHKLNYRVEKDGSNVVLDCPFCGADRERFGVHKETKNYNCFKCDIRGIGLKSLNNRLFKLAKGEIKQRKEIPEELNKKEVCKIDKTLTDKLHTKLRKTKGNKAIPYFRQARGFSNECIKHFKLGYRVFKNKSGEKYPYTAIPYLQDGIGVNVKYRTLTPPPEDEADFKMWKKFKWRREVGGISALFNGDVITDETDSIFITEAEMDCMSLWSQGYKNVVSVTVGAKGFKTAWYDKLSKVKKIFLVFDNDVTGQDGAFAMAKRIGFDKCYNVVLPDTVKDLNEFFWDGNAHQERYSIDDFNELVVKAKPFELPDSHTGQDMLKEMMTDLITGNEAELVGLQSPFDSLNEILPKVKPGHMTVVAARPKVGKTTLALFWVYCLLKAGYKVLFICCEMRPKALQQKLLQMHRKDYSNEVGITEEMILEMNVAIPNENIVYKYPNPDLLEDEKKLAEYISDCVQRYGSQVLVFDNIQFMSRSKDGKTADKAGVASRMFKMTTELHDMHSFIISQPRKTNHNRPLDVDDLKDTSSIYQDLDHLILLHRAFEDDDSGASVKKGIMSEMMDVKVVSRWGDGGTCRLWMNGERGVFKDSGPSFDRYEQDRREALKAKMQKQRSR